MHKSNGELIGTFDEIDGIFADPYTEEGRKEREAQRIASDNYNEWLAEHPGASFADRRRCMADELAKARRFVNG